MEPLTVPVRVYLDTNLFIDLVEGSDDIMRAAGTLFQSLIAREEQIITRELTLAEVFSKPCDDIVRERYEVLLDRDGFLTLAPVSRDVLLAAAGLRARHGGKPPLPDAIHLATAMVSGSQAVVSRNVRDFQKFCPPDMAFLAGSADLAQWLESKPL